ncbi:MAG: aminotransferase class I/II-fold pyridoxal phosphate-dependent enzyme [Cloacibacterium sp.]|nr:aminotransferase class I/II-fold pyridoxal phosphate-dependent enzyme [Cloacibacterium sp.]MBP8060579.1 aminotransferase class I/II-fold pyridoxal phosphate-dependent enzyme [Cloacibacterium sp.]MBP8085515.1 aminotransferase class I/II-fold pyridoxal phosphate-dependent enzyme [Cloacibacterium sp.]
MSGNEMKYVQEAFDGNWIAPLGPNVDGFEKDLEQFLGEGTHVAAVNTGTAALHLALVMLGVEKDDYVICQSLTFSASANPIIYLGGIPIFVDSEPDTWNICPNALEDAVKSCIKKGKKPKAIITVCLYGMPYKVDEIREISDKYGIPILEDSAEALGSTYKGQKCGTFGDISVLSFNGNKIITTSGGGALVLKDEIYKKKAVFLSTQAKDDAPHYQHSIVGYNYRLSNVCAGIGRGQMEVINDRVALRRKNHEFYKEIFTSFVGVNFFSEPSLDFFSNHWLNAVIIDPNKTNGFRSEDLRYEFQKENIESRPLWKPMHMQPLFNKAEYFGAIIAEKLFKFGLCLPSGSNMSNKDRERISEVIYKVFKAK